MIGTTRLLRLLTARLFPTRPVDPSMRAGMVLELGAITLPFSTVMTIGGAEKRS